jgi:antirestriction protein ArdC
MYTQKQLESKGFRNINAITKRFYLGLWNQLALHSRGYSNPEWLTYRQASQEWLRIKKWAKSTPVCYQEFVPVVEVIDDEPVTAFKVYKKIHHVFNIEDTEPVLSPSN